MDRYRSNFPKLAVAVGILTLVLLFQSTRSVAANWYVNSAATGTNRGTSWDNGWTDFSSVSWGATGVKAGDTLYISGGTTSRTYATRLLVGASGTAEAPITIRIGQEAGHNGVAIISPTTDYHSSIHISDQSFIVISGQVGTGIEPHIQCTPLKIGGCGLYVDKNSSNFNISYLDLTGSLYCGMYIILYDTAESGEVHHCRIHDNLQDEGRILTWNTSLGTRFGIIKIHDNDIYDFHNDAIKVSLNGVDFYNNKIHDRGTFGDLDHPDGMQIWSNYLRIYSNNFYNFIRTDDSNVNSFIRYNPIPPRQTTPGNVQIFNNLFTETKIPITKELLRGIELSIGRDGILTARNFLIANNTFQGIPFFSLFLGLGTLPSDNVSDIRIVNNIFKDVARTGFSTAVMLLTTGDGSIHYGSQGDNVNVVIDYNSVSASSSIFNTNFVLDLGVSGSETLSYPSFIAKYPIQKNGVFGNPSLDSFYKPATDISSVVDRGLDLSPLFSTDFNGSTRPQGTGWDIGAYESSFTRRVGIPLPIGSIPGTPSGIKIM